MNPLIEFLDRCGGNAVRFAGPMLWQSSALIIVLFAADFALRRHVRAAVRHALWLVVLVKLLLPPSLALPTSATWWLFPSAKASAKPQITHFTVSYGDATPAPSQPAAVFTPSPAPSMSVSAWMVLAWSAMSLSLLAWLMVRWRQVMRDAGQTIPAPTWLNELFNDAKCSAGLRRAVGLRVTTHAMSPAVCGLFRPVILLPQSLLEKLPPVQLRAVLLHELTHLRRGDVWVNCAQALVQIFYWWHPLLWPANARIRRVREEAVDDAVMLTLRDDAEVYAPTLLEVAKLAFHRPLASLGLVGILESRSALRQRIERRANRG
jgi:bla regulator protein BlaR1